MCSFRFLVPLVFVFGSCSIARADLHDEALVAAKQATAFLTDHVSTQGGYLWSYSADLQTREGEGEGAVDTETVWVQPPGTPAVGIAFVNLYQSTNDQQFLDAALAAADALRRGQMRSGGWQASVEFDADRSKRWAYRMNTPNRCAKDQSSLDDNKTQSALEFLIRLDEALLFKNETIHEMTLFGLDGLLERGQFSGGGFPQVWTSSRPDGTDTPRRQASYPEDWPRIYPGHREYWYRYTLNDHLASDVERVKTDLGAPGVPFAVTPANTYVHSKKFDRFVKLLQIAEAVRNEVAINDGNLPDSLDAITIVPIPMDPLTGKRFLYELDGDVATLRTPPIAGLDDATQQSASKTYKISVANSQN